MKYKIREDLSIDYKGKKLYRIEALKDFSDVKKGDLGGFIESYNNLNQKGNCWIFGDAEVYGNAKVCGYAKIKNIEDYFVFKLSCRFLTFCKDSKIGINVSIGCQKGISLEKFEKRIFEDGGYVKENLPKHRKEYLEAINLVKKLWS